VAVSRSSFTFYCEVGRLTVAHRFDRLVKSLHTRRATLSLATSIGVLLGPGQHGATEARRKKKKCGPCRRRKKGKCKPKPNNTPCGPCRACAGGRCQALCPADDCAGDGEDAVCLFACDPPCDTCSRCDRLLGQCEPLCESEFCVGEFCRVPCDLPCGECSTCDFGECVPLCEGEQCVDDRCEIPCDPTCGAGAECVEGECYPVCDPACESDQACVDGACVDTARDCPTDPGACFVEGAVRCHGQIARCVETIGGDQYCAQSISCAPCETHVDCQNQGFGSNSRCVGDCDFRFGTGGSGCVEFAGG
jgi:hypothetical protein